MLRQPPRQWPARLNRGGRTRHPGGHHPAVRSVHVVSLLQDLSKRSQPYGDTDHPAHLPTRRMRRPPSPRPRTAGGLGPGERPTPSVSSTFMPPGAHPDTAERRSYVGLIPFRMPRRLSARHTAGHGRRQPGRDSWIRDAERDFGPTGGDGLTSHQRSPARPHRPPRQAGIVAGLTCGPSWAAGCWAHSDWRPSRSGLCDCSLCRRREASPSCR